MAYATDWVEIQPPDRIPRDSVRHTVRRKNTTAAHPVIDLAARELARICRLTVGSRWARRK
jgi:hypothetical protein